MDFLPFVPCTLQAHGSVGRKLEPHRKRRIFDGGMPRSPTFDTQDQLVVPLNQAVTGLTSVSRAVFEADPDAYQQSVSRDAILARWPRELKPSIPL